jgi:hypothetical protein
MRANTDGREDLRQPPARCLDRSVPGALTLGTEDLQERTLDPSDWGDIRALGHQMLDDTFDYLQYIRERPVWQPIPAEAVSADYAPTLCREGSTPRLRHMFTGELAFRMEQRRGPGNRQRRPSAAGAAYNTRKRFPQRQSAAPPHKCGGSHDAAGRFLERFQPAPRKADAQPPAVSGSILRLKAVAAVRLRRPTLAKTARMGHPERQRRSLLLKPCPDEKPTLPRKSLRHPVPNRFAENGVVALVRGEADPSPSALRAEGSG